MTKAEFNPPPVNSTFYVTGQMAIAGADDFIDKATVAALFASLRAVDPDLGWRHDYAHGDQYGVNGGNWKGRKPADGTESDFLTMLVLNDQIGPAMAREVDAQFAKDAEWDAVQDGERLDADSDLVRWLSDWHEEAGLNGAAKDAARTHWWAGRMVGRVYVPNEYAERLLSNPPETIDDALQLIHVQAVDPREGGPIVDSHKRVLGYWHRYTREVEGQDRPQQIVEVHTPRHVLMFVQGDDGKLTLDDAADNPFYDPTQPERLRRSEYLMWHIDRDGGSSITPSVRDAQDRLGVVTTYAGRNDDQTGYRQIIVSNAEQFVDETGKPVPFPMGPGVAVALKGLLVNDPENPPVNGASALERHTPTWQVIEPLNPEEFHIPSINLWKRTILERLDQLWTLNPETSVSGESRRQSRKPFDRRASFAGQNVGAFLAWALRAALMLARQMTGERDYDNVTFQPRMFLDVDAANLEELRVKLSMWQAGALTLVSLLESTPGVSDAAKEAASVEKEVIDAAPPQAS